MKRSHTIIASLIIAAGISGAAIAQSSRGCDGMGPMGMGPGMTGGPSSAKFDPAVRVQRHLDMFKGQLKLTPEQEPLWQAFAEKMKAEAGKGMQGMRTQTPDPKLTAPERMAKMETMMGERLAAMKTVHESFNRLYAALTPEQKVVADQHAAQMGQGMGAKVGKGGPARGPGMGTPPQTPPQN
jgi:hypothetical protein